MRMKKQLCIAATLGALVAAWASPRAQQGPKIRTLAEQEVADILVGSSIQGTRNGNSAGMIRFVSGSA